MQSLGTSFKYGLNQRMTNLAGSVIETVPGNYNPIEGAEERKVYTFNPLNEAITADHRSTKVGVTLYSIFLHMRCAWSSQVDPSTRQLSVP